MNKLNKKTLKEKMTVTDKKQFLGTASLMAGMFFLPFGYDVLFLTIMKLTNSYWITDSIFYSLSASFFILHFIYSRKVLLMFGMFFLPFGYDLLFKTILDYSGSYAITDSIFYMISAMFLLMHFWITQKNPIGEAQKRTIETTKILLDFKSRM